MIKFDKQLQTFSHRLTLLRLLKNQLSTSADEVYKTIMMSDKQGKGFFSPRQIEVLWLQNSNVEQNFIQKFISFCFPVQKISYSLLSRFVCLRQEISNSTQKTQNKKGDDILKQIKEIFSLQLANYVTFCNLNQQITTYIPYVGSKPTKTQFQDYVICKQLLVDIQAVSKALFLAQVPQIIPHMSQADKFESELGSPSVQNIRKIMQRLKQKVNAFGNEWLN